MCKVLLGAHKRPKGVSFGGNPLMENGLVFDIGANNGNDADAFSKQPPAARVELIRRSSHE
jgi:hypothetical protein